MLHADAEPASVVSCKQIIMTSSSDMKLSNVAPGVYLGDIYQAQNLDLLNSCGITHILPVGSNLYPYFPSIFTYFPRQIDVLDKDNEDLLSHFDECFEFVESCLKTGGNVFIHCVAGVSRSAAIAVGFLMKQKQIRYLDALKLVQTARSSVNINSGFVKQLLLYQKLRYSIDQNSQEYLRFKTQHESAYTTNRQNIIYLPCPESVK
jgi:dual specificity phosphatase 12